MDPNKRKNCFELFGFDFILDEDFNVWMIEVNTNPCIEESSSLLRSYLPRMIDDMLKLSVDQLFADFHPQDKLDKHSSDNDNKDTSLSYPVANYDDQENMWYVFLL